jgi:hypothetical protein|tara:strand:- start:2976 stop:3719 length:744 start_codon:yes stop_codon:yes gene_type:complete
MTDPTQDYFAKLKALQSQQQPMSTYDDISKRASELSMLMPKTQTRGLYLLASDLSKGLVQQAASGRPSSIGYGLAAGFNLYSEAAQQRQEKVEEMRSQLMQMAYADVEKRREESRAMQATMLDAQFKYDLQQMKETRSGYGGTSPESRDLDNMIRGEYEPEFKLTPEYKFSKARLQKPKPGVTQTEGGLVNVLTPGLDIDAIFGSSQITAGPEHPNAIFTGRYFGGKPIFAEPNTSGGTDEFTLPKE